MNTTAYEKLQELRNRLAETPPFPWDGMASWIASASPLFRTQFSDHQADFERYSLEPRWIQYMRVSSGRSIWQPDVRVDNFAEAEADELRDNGALASAAKARVLAWLDGLLDLHRPDAIHDVAPQKRATGTPKRVFVVHGHDDAAREAVARFLERLKLEPVILGERANEGKTIIEKFEHHADVDFAIVLLTPDDIGHAVAAANTSRNRARQNVVLELGYFVGRLGRHKVCALHKGDLELPSDYHGVLYIPMDSGGAWRLGIAKEMKAAQLDIDMNDAV